VAGVAFTDRWVLWTAVLAGPVAWAVQLQAVYTLAAPVSEGGLPAWLHLTSLVCLLAATAGAWLGWRGWRTVGGWPSERDEPRAGRVRLLTVLGVLTSLLFSVVIVAQWLAVVILPVHRTGAG
jgi:hypothetical protein